MAQTVQAIRGMNDLLPENTSVWQKIEKVIRSTLNSYGYQEVRMPIVEKTMYSSLLRVRPYTAFRLMRLIRRPARAGVRRLHCRTRFQERKAATKSGSNAVSIRSRQL